MRTGWTRGRRTFTKRTMTPLDGTRSGCRDISNWPGMTGSNMPISSTRGKGMSTSDLPLHRLRRTRERMLSVDRITARWARTGWSLMWKKDFGARIFPCFSRAWSRRCMSGSMACLSGMGKILLPLQNLT